MTDRVQYHKQWRQQKKQSVASLQESVDTLTAELKRFLPLLELSDEQLLKIIEEYTHVD
jgi:hypothetical protein